MLYAVGSMLVIKSVDGSKDKFLKGHSSRITFITVSKQGNLIASGESQDIRQDENAALIVWDFNTLEILYRVKHHK
jgi:WD40 repeat protein